MLIKNINGVRLTGKKRYVIIFFTYSLSNDKTRLHNSMHKSKLQNICRLQSKTLT